MWKTGHSLIKARMQETNAELAGEMSGHMFFADRYYGFDDALYAACRLLEIVSKSGEPLSAQLSDLPPTFATPEIRVDCPDDEEVRNCERRPREIPARITTSSRSTERVSISAKAGDWCGHRTRSPSWCCASRRNRPSFWRNTASSSKTRWPKPHADGRST